MKKLLVFAVALLALGFAANSFAIQAEIPADTTAVVAKGKTQITIGGEIRLRGQVSDNNGDFNRHQTNESGPFGKNERMLYDYRYRLDVKAQVSPNTIGFLRFEASGPTADDAVGVWGTGPMDGRGSFQYGDMRTNNVNLNQAWIQHSGSGLLGIPAYIKVGHQPITVGAGVFYSHTYNNDDAIVLGISPIKGLDLTLLTVKMAENQEAFSDDADLYSFMLNYAINKDWKVGFDASWLNVQNQEGWTVNTNLFNIGLNLKATPVPGLKVYATGDIQFGDVDWGPGISKQDFRGYAVTFGGSYKFAPVTVGLDFGYGSGSNANDTNKIKTFMTAQSNVVHYAFVYDYYTRNAGGNKVGGLQNTMFAKLSAKGDIMKGLSAGGSIIFLGSAKKTMGDNYAFGMVETSSKYIGTEIDANLTYQIDKGLKYFVEAGYLFAGNYWKWPVNSYYGRNLGDSVSDPWVVRHGIQLNF